MLVQKTTEEIIDSVVNVIINPAIGLLFVVALLVMFWGIFEFIKNVDDEAGRSAGKRHLIWGVIGMFIMVSAVAIVMIIQATIKSL